MIVVFGGKGTVHHLEQFLIQLTEFSQEEDITVQALDATVVYGKEHLISAAEHALRAFQQGTQSTNSLSLELLLYASGDRQIKKAIAKMGVKQGKRSVAFVVIDSKTRERKAYEKVIDRLLNTIGFSRDDTVLDGDRETLKRFGIRQQELRTVPEQKYGEIILEKVALVDVIK